MEPTVCLADKVAMWKSGCMADRYHASFPNVSMVTEATQIDYGGSSRAGDRAATERRQRVNHAIK
jgi:hypothetical protein